jgi:ferredoxin
VTVRPTTAAAYTDGRGAYLPRETRIVEGRAIAGERAERADVCVVGTGAGRAVVAKELAEAGLRVAMLEEGDYFPTDAFTGHAAEMMRTFYRDARATPTVGRPPLLVAMGRGVGGSTLVNAGTCFRTPASVLDRWARRFGVEVSAVALDPFFRRVERELNVTQVPAEVAGRNAAVARRGAEALGWSGDYAFRNARGCVGSGLCAFGCPTSAKQHVGLVDVPQAWDAGATTYTRCRARRILVEARRARGVEAVTAFTPGLSDPIAARVTPQVALEAMTSGRRYPAGDALRLALVDATAGAEEVVARAVSIATSLAGKDPGTYGRIKAQLHRRVIASLRDADANAVDASAFSRVLP